MPYPLKIATINVNSLISNQKRLELLSFANKNDTDIVLINETKLKKEHRITYKDFDIIRNDRDYNSGGGTAILVKKNIHYDIINLDKNLFKFIETTIIRTKVSEDKNILIIAIYVGKCVPVEFSEELDKLFKTLNLENDRNYYYMAGDFNAKHPMWNNNTTNRLGTALYNFLNNNDITYRTKLYRTEYPSYKNAYSYLDIVLSDARINIMNLNNNENLDNLPFDSDHDALIAIIEIDNMNLTIENDENNNLDWRKADWNEFKDYLNKKDNLNIDHRRNLNLDEIQNFNETINKHILEAIKVSVPTKKPYDSCNTYVNEKITKLKKMKNKLLSDLNKLRKSSDPRLRDKISETQNIINEFRIKINEEFKNSINNYWKNKIQKISAQDPSRMFQGLNLLYRKKEQASIDDLKITDTNILRGMKINKHKYKKLNSIMTITDDMDKLKIIGKSFEKVHTQNRKLGKKSLNTFGKKIAEEIRDYKSKETLIKFDDNNTSLNPEYNEIENYFTNILDMQKLFKKINLKKSSGLDKIPNISLKNLPVKYVVYYTIIFNNLLNHMEFPDYWKTAKVIPIKKKGKDTALAINYRPISLLPNISKAYEAIINKFLTKFCNENDIIPEQQFGFRKNHSTIHAINKLTSDITWAQNEGKCVGAILVDIEKAFDTASQNNILIRMKSSEFPVPIIKLTQNMISTRKFKVACGKNITEETFIVKEGLQQGTVNSPILFNILTAPLLKNNLQNKVPNIKSIAFADDYIAYVIGDDPRIIKTRLQNLYNFSLKWYSTWSLKTNPAKSEIILFRPKFKDCIKYIHPKMKHFKIENKDGKHVIQKKIVKYLGINIDNTLKFNKHVKIQLEKAKKAFYAHSKLFYSKHLEKRVKIICYMLLVRPILTYGCQIWYNTVANQMEKLRLFERQCLRVCLRMYKTPESEYKKHYSSQRLYDKAGIIKIDDFIVQLCRDYFYSIRNVEYNPLITSMIYPQNQYFENAMAKGYVPPEAFVYLDSRNYITDKLNNPILYYISRNNNKILYPPSENMYDIWDKIRFNTARSINSKNSYHDKRYWWLRKDY